MTKMVASISGVNPLWQTSGYEPERDYYEQQTIELKGKG